MSPNKNGVTTTIRMATVSSEATGVQVGGYQWLPIITKRNQRSMSLATSGVLDGPTTANGSLELLLGPDFSNQEYASYEWSGALGRIFEGIEGDPFSSYQQVFEGSVGSITRQGNRATVELLGAEAALAFDLLTATYAGTGGVEGPIGMKGNLKPRLFGSCLSVEPVQVDAANLVYQVHGYGAVNAISAVYDFGQALDPARFVGDQATYAALIGLTLTNGQWATCKALGLFRLGNTPKAKITADVSVGTGTVAAIASSLFAIAGVSGSKIGSMTALGSKPWCEAVTSQISIGEALRGMISGAGCYLLADGTGTWQFGNWLAPKTATTLSTSGASFPIVKQVKELAAPPPVWKVRVGYDRCWGVHSENEVSPALAQVSDAQIATNQVALDAQATASAAAANATAALNRLNDITNDNVLDRSDKALLLRDYQAITAEKATLNSSASSFGITTENTALNTAYTSLTSYLNGLSPAYTDFSVETPISGTTLRQKFVDYYSARNTLNAAIAAKTATLANWTGVSGMPTPITTVTNTTVIDNSNVTITAGGQINNGVTTLGPVVDNSRLTLGSNGVLWGGGPASVPIDALLIANGAAQAGATSNPITYSATAPTSPANNSIWIDTSVTPNITRVRVGGAWQISANYVTNTNQVTDGAGLGTTATWSGVTGANRPADNATVGAQAGVNLRDSTGTTLGDSAIKNTAITVNGSGILSGIGTASITVDNTRLTLGSNGVLTGGGASSAPINALLITNGPAQANADRTSLNTAAYLNGQGPWATTSTPINTILAPGLNPIYNSGFNLGLQGWIPSDAYWSTGQGSGTNIAAYNPPDARTGTLTQEPYFSLAAGSYYTISLRDIAFNATRTIKLLAYDAGYYPTRVPANDIVYTTGVTNLTKGSMSFYLASNTKFRLEVAVTTSSIYNYYQITQIKVDTGQFASAWSDDFTTGASYYSPQPYGTGTNLIPIDSLKPGEIGANVTETRTALYLNGQGSLATRNDVRAGTHIRDSSGAILNDNAIRNIDITINSDGTMSNIGTSGVVVDNTKQLWTQVLSRPANISSLTGSESILNTGISLNANGTITGAGGGAVTIGGLGYTGALNATVNIVTSSSTAPASPNNGDIWIDTSVTPNLTKVRVAGAWVVGANYVTNTNQVTDGAGLGTTAVWTSVTSRPTNLSGLDSTAATKLTGIQTGADVTAQSQHNIVAAVPTIDFAADYTNVLLTGQISKTVAIKRQLGTTDVTASTTWALTSTAGITASINSTGLVSFTAVANGAVIVTGTYNSVALQVPITITRTQGAAPAGGGSGATSASTTAISGATSTSYVTGTSGTLTLNAGSSGTINLTAGVDFYIGSPTSYDQYQDTYGKWQWRVSGGTYADVTSEVASSYSAFQPRNGGTLELTIDSENQASGGRIDVNQAKGGLTSGQTYDFRFVWRLASGGPSVNGVGSFYAVQG